MTSPSSSSVSTIKSKPTPRLLVAPNAGGANANSLRSSVRGTQPLLPSRTAVVTSSECGATATATSIATAAIAPSKALETMCPTRESLHASLRKRFSLDSERRSTGSMSSNHLSDLTASFNSSCSSKAEPSQSLAALTCSGAGADGAQTNNSKRSQLVSKLTIPTLETPHSIIAEQQGARVPVRSCDTMAEVCFDLSSTPTQGKLESNFEFQISNLKSQTIAVSASASSSFASASAS